VSEPTEYGDEAALVSRIRDFVHRYVDVSEDFETIATYYILFTWVYDAFHEVPYVRIRGGYGTGKTRFLLAVGSLCRFAIFASAASTVSPLFRLLDAFRGTLILDEGDFRASDEKSEVVKILNNGNARGFPVLRTEVSPKKEFDPRRTTSSVRRSWPPAASSRTEHWRAAALPRTCAAARPDARFR
jgi:hypothetical protein